MSKRTIENYNKRQQAQLQEGLMMRAYINHIEATIAEQDEEEALLHHVLMVHAWMQIPRVFNPCPCCGSYEMNAYELLVRDPEFVKFITRSDVIAVIRKYGKEIYEASKV